ncbi:MAG: SAM-dependent methyltransferase [Acidobacteriota bacterium]
MRRRARTAFEWAVEQAELGRVPDVVIRTAIRRLLAARLAESARGGVEAQREREEALVEAMRGGPIAPAPDEANEQHYELPAELFEIVLGPRLKYSACLWPEGVSTLAAAEEAALALTCERAELRDGQTILELGCGWGSLSLWMAERYPSSRVLAVSNSTAQRAFIEARRDARGLANLDVVTADMNAFATEARFDRIVSVEMFEHMRNWDALCGRIAGWLAPGGKLFVHVFCHRAWPYLFETAGATDWMGRHFFTGGLMPCDDLLPRASGGLRLERRWAVDGRHYARTLLAWLANLNAARDRLRPILARTYGPAEARRWFGRWRLFFLACAEMFAWRGGSEWYVAHYRLSR